MLHRIIDQTYRPGEAHTALKKIRQRLCEVYITARDIDVDQLVESEPEVQAQYAQIMDCWRKVHIVLDTLPREATEDEYNTALRRCRAHLAALPSWQLNQSEIGF